MANDNVRRRREREIETEQASAGEAQRLGPSAVRARAAAPGLLPQHALDERQAAIPPRRRRGGPPVDRDTSEEAVAARVPDVPPTECAEPPPTA